jgi:glycosyltransferase involved in cell wall biosynthesis
MTETETRTPSGRRVLAPPPPRGAPASSRSEPTFSVVVAAHNAADTLRETVVSALTQTYPPVDVIVCDDCSPADERGAISDLLDSVTYLRNPENRGVGGAKQTAAAAARGDWIVPVDADDLMKPTRIEALAELASLRPDLDILATDADIEVDGKVVRRAYREDWSFDVADQRREILRRCFIFIGALRRTRLVEVGGFTENRLAMEDWDVYGRLLLTGSEAGLVDEPLYRYRVHEGQTSVSWSSRLHKGELETLEALLVHPALEEEERPILEQTIARVRRQLAMAEAKEALVERGGEARRLSLAVARDREQPPRTRVKAALSALAPAVSTKLLRRRAATEWQGSAGVRVKRG